MAVQTNVSPYFDDFDETKNYVKVLFKPGVAVQSRELTQSQTIVQNQIKQVGNFLFTDSDKVLGPKPIVNLNARTVKLSPLDIRGNPIDVNNFLGTYVTGDTPDLIGYVEFVYTADDPNLGDPPSIIISLKKFNSINDGMFDQTEQLKFFIDYTDALNDVTPNYIATTTTDITKNAISTLSLYSKTITFTSPTTLILVGDLLVHPALTKKLYVTEVVNTLEVIVNDAPGVTLGGETISFVTKATNPTSIITQDTATFYKYGYFVRNTLQKIVPDKATAYPTRLVAFLSDEQIITSEDDNTLLDPAFESSNYFASGADRLKIDLSITSLDLGNKSVAQFVKLNDTDTTNKNIIPLIYFNKGQIEYLRELSVDSTLEKKLAERTYDESGSYVVNEFVITPKNSLATDNNIYFDVGPGKAYVGGFQVRTVGGTEIVIPKSSKTETITGYNINTLQGNYLKVSNVKYSLIPPQTTTASTNFLELHNVRNPTAANTRVGTISFKNLEYNTSLGADTEFKFFYNYYAPITEAPADWASWATKYNIPSEEGQYIANVLYTNNNLLGNFGVVNTAYYGLFREPDVSGVAQWWTYWNANGRDIAKVKEAFAIAATTSTIFNDATRVLTQSKSYLEVINNSPFIDGLTNVQQVKSIVGVANELTNYGTSATYATPFFYAEIADSGLTANNIVVFDKIPADKLVYPVNKAYIKTLKRLKTEYNKVYNNAIFSGGTFSKTLSIPETLAVGDGNIPASTARSNFTVLIKSGATANTKIGPFNFERGSVTVTGSSATVSFSLGDPSFNGIADVSLKIQNDNTQIRTKTLVPNNISTLNINAADKNFTLAKSDIFNFNAIFLLSNVSKYLGNWISSNSYTYNDIVTYNGAAFTSISPSSNVSVYEANSWTQLTAQNFANYVLDDGQRDSFYDHGSVRFIGASSAIPGNVIISYDYFTHSGEGPLTVESYDANIYGSIPGYRSVTDAKTYNLRDCIDFRARRVDGSIYQTYDTAIIPVSDVTTEADVTYLVGRVDRLYVTNTLQNFESPYNSFYVEQGVESTSPSLIKDNTDFSKLSIATIVMPPYVRNAFDVQIFIDDNKRYTMKDIAKIERLTYNLDKAVKIHSIEIANIKGILTNDNGESLLKSGILVESFSDLNKLDSLSSTIACAINTDNGTCSPMLEFDTLDFDLVPNQNVVSNSDMITMLYDEEVFISQTEANSFIYVNPGAIDDGKGRATTSVQNSRRSNNTKKLIQLALLVRSIYCYYYPWSPFCIGGVVNAILRYIGDIAIVAAAVAVVVYVAKVVVKVAQEAIKVAEKVVNYASDKANEVTDKIADVGGW
jgi:hypothetical protein